MSIQIKYEELEEKLEKLCDDNDLHMEFMRHQFPIIFKFTPMPSNIQQLKLEEVMEDEKTNRGASIEMIFGDELMVRVTKNFSIDDNTLTALKNNAKKLHHLFLQVWHMTHMLAKQLPDGDKITREIKLI